MVRLQRASSKAPINLGKELGRGGEGAVYPVVGAPQLVAKVYLKPPSAAKAEKLRAMAHSATPALLRVAAWPVDVLADEAGLVRGFLMPRVSARADAHELYSPKSRRQAFPGADFRFIVRAAANIARAFAQVHAQGNVIGDVNHGNALVGRDGTVVLIDCDSFQVRDAGRIFTCDVGVPLFTPPELYGQGFRGLRRTPEHDAFGLAVLIFHLLFLGRHPFAGKYTDGDMPIERAIAESRFAYGAKAASFGMSAPPGTLPLGAFGAHCAQLFEQAFAPPGGARRPAPTQWIGVLQALESELVACGASPAHFFPGGGPGCCWCALEAATGVRLFGRQVLETGAAAMAKLARAWDAIAAIPPPLQAQPLEMPRSPGSVSTNPDPLGGVPRIVLSGALVFAGLAALAVNPGEHILLAALSFAAAIATRFRKWGLLGRIATPASARALRAARAELAQLIKEWNDGCTEDRFEQRLRKLNTLRERVFEMPRERAARVQALQDVASHTQLERYLETILIGKARLPHVSAQEVSMLAAFDIESAQDVLRKNIELPAISATATREVVAWAQACARSFRFDPARGADPEAIREIDRALHKEQEQLLEELRVGHDDLAHLSAQISMGRSHALDRIRAARGAVAAAEKARA